MAVGTLNKGNRCGYLITSPRTCTIFLRGSMFCLTAHAISQTVSCISSIYRSWGAHLWHIRAFPSMEMHISTHISCVYVKPKVQGSAMSWVLLVAGYGREGKTGWDLDTRVSYLPTRQLGQGQDAHRHWLCYYKSSLCDLNSSLSPSALLFSAAELLSWLYIP